MKLLLNANLSWRLTKRLKTNFAQVFHVNQIGLTLPASDVEIWEWAKNNQSIIVTNDDDFFNPLMQRGFPPKIVLLRVGNQSTKSIAEILIQHRTQIDSLYQNDEYGLLEIV